MQELEKLIITYIKLQHACKYQKSVLDTDQLMVIPAVLYREVSLIQRYIFTQLYVVGSAGSVLIRDRCLRASFIEVPLYQEGALDTD